jgi:DME family drug/metabolite transporter
MRVSRVDRSIAHHPNVASPRAGLPFLITSGLLWGTGGLLGSLLGRVGGLSPLAVASYRLTVGGGLILAVLLLGSGARSRGRWWPRGRAAWVRILTQGVLTASYQGCYFVAVSLTSVSLATLVTIGASPVLVMAVERATGRRRFDRRMAVTAVLALTGLGLLVGLPSGGLGLPAVLAGAGLALAAAIGFAVMTLLGTRPVPGLDDLTMTGLGFAMGGTLLAALAGPTVGLGFRPRPDTLGLLAALGAVPTAIAYALYFRGLRTAAASTAAVMALLEPLTGTILATVLLGDRLNAAGILGAVLLAGGVVLAATAPDAGHAVNYNAQSDVYAQTGEGT